MRHEFIDGVVYALVGGTGAHRRLEATMIAGLHAPSERRAMWRLLVGPDRQCLVFSDFGRVEERDKIGLKEHGVEPSVGDPDLPEDESGALGGLAVRRP